MSGLTNLKTVPEGAGSQGLVRDVYQGIAQEANKKSSADAWHNALTLSMARLENHGVSVEPANDDTYELEQTNE